jgi:hypothetical protein
MSSFTDYRNRGGTAPGFHAECVHAQVEVDRRPVTLPDVLFLRSEGEALWRALLVTRRFVELEQVSS